MRVFFSSFVDSLKVLSPNQESGLCFYLVPAVTRHLLLISLGVLLYLCLEPSVI